MKARQLIEADEPDDKDELLAGAPTHYLIRGTTQDDPQHPGRTAYLHFYSGLGQWSWTSHRDEATPIAAERVDKFKEFMEQQFVRSWTLDLVPV